MVAREATIRNLYSQKLTSLILAVEKFPFVSDDAQEFALTEEHARVKLGLATLVERLHTLKVLVDRTPLLEQRQVVCVDDELMTTLHDLLKRLGRE